MDFSSIDKYLEDHTAALLSDLAALIAVPSKRTAAEDGKPFGKACAEALALMETLAKDAGLATQNHENYMLQCDYCDSETVLGIIAHLDVVPEGDGWDTPPFELTEKDGAVYGRGAIDNKGPAAAVLYAVKSLKANGVKLSKNVRLLFGSDEESGMADLAYYRQKRPLPKMMLSPDGQFPIINVEKGLCQLSFKKRVFSPSALISFHSGSVVNAVPDKAEAVLIDISPEMAEAAIAAAGTTLDVQAASCGDGVRLSAKGVSAHGSTPEKGDNALTGLLKVIGGLPKDELLSALDALLSLFPYGEGDGEHLGLKMRDEESGPLTALLSILNIEDGLISGGVDIRFPATVPLDKIKEIVKAKLLPLGFELDFTHCMEGHVVPSDSDFVRTLLSCYTDVTGLKGECIAEGGATYLHTVDGGVAFGAELPNEENNMHGANEHVKISTLLTVAKIYARAIYSICK